MPKKASKRMKGGKPVFVVQPSLINGSGWLDDAWSAVKSIAAPVNDVLKQTKLISTIGSLIPNPYVQSGAKIAGSLGYGRMKGKGKFKVPSSKVIKA
jgi:hypothetical protein